MNTFIKGLKFSAAIIFALPWATWILGGGFTGIWAMAEVDFLMGLAVFVLWGISAGMTHAILNKIETL